MAATPYPDTPDDPDFGVRGRLRHRSNPALAEREREALVADLMTARRVVRSARQTTDAAALARARAALNAARVALGKSGPVGWTDGSPDLNRHRARTTTYADVFAARGLEGPR